MPTTSPTTQVPFRAAATAITAVAALLFSHAPALAQATPDIADVEFATIQGQPLLLDVYHPPNATTHVPAVIYIHGGGWRSGSKESVLPGIAVRSRGIALISVSYRLTSQAGQWGTAPVTWPAQIHDVKAAIRYVRANAHDLGVDPDRLAVWGVSAGGHLALSAALIRDNPELEGTLGNFNDTPSCLKAAAAWYPPTDLINAQEDFTDPPGSLIDHNDPESGESQLVGWSLPGQGIGDIRDNVDNPNPPYPQLVKTVADASPLSHASPLDPPVFIAHGDMDTTVAVAQSAKLAAALSAVGAPVEYIPVQDGVHGLLGLPVTLATIDFLEAALLAPGPPCTTPKCPDFDANGATDLQDLLTVLANFAQDPAPFALGNTDDNTAIDLTDLLTVLAAFGNQCP